MNIKLGICIKISIYSLRQKEEIHALKSAERDCQLRRNKLHVGIEGGENDCVEEKKI